MPAPPRNRILPIFPSLAVLAFMASTTFADGIQALSTEGGVTTVTVNDVTVKFQGLHTSITSVKEVTTIEVKGEDGPLTVSTIGWEFKDKVSTKRKVSRIEFRGAEVRITTEDGRLWGFDLPAGTIAAPAVPGAKPSPQTVGLTTDQLMNIIEEIDRMAADAAPVDRATLRAGLERTGLTRAATYLDFDSHLPPADVSRDIRKIVDETIRKYPARLGTRTPSTVESLIVRSGDRASGANVPRLASGPKDEVAEWRCECEFCHPLHEAGTCPYPPASPMVAWPAPSPWRSGWVRR